MESIFTLVKGNISTRQAVEAYGIAVNRSGMACCPFHPDRHPSMLVDEHHFYCFGCQAKGDVIDFTARYFDLRPYEAAKKLAADFHLRPLPPGQSAALKPPKLPAAIQERKEQLRVMDELIAYERLLKQWQQEYAPSPETEVWDKRFSAAVLQAAMVRQTIDCLLSCDAEERRQALASLRRDGSLERIERILNENKQGGDQHAEGEKRAA